MLTLGYKSECVRELGVEEMAVCGGCRGMRNSAVAGGSPNRLARAQTGNQIVDVVDGEDSDACQGTQRAAYDGVCMKWRL